jgi:hypothetical protein
MHKPVTTDRSFTHNRGCINPGTVHRDTTAGLAAPTGSPTKPPLASSSPTNTASAAQSPALRGSARPKGRVLAMQRGATFTHFTVSLRQVRRDADVEVMVVVCVRSLPPDPQGNRTRISWDPWSISTGSTSVDAGKSTGPLTGGLPAAATYRVGECASGWIPFPTPTWPTRIIYKNGVGDVAVWDTRHPRDAPQTS